MAKTRMELRMGIIIKNNCVIFKCFKKKPMFVICVIIFCLTCFQSVKAQGIESVEIVSVRWLTRTFVPITIDNIGGFADSTLVIKDGYFCDYLGCLLNKLSPETISNEHSIKSIHLYVKIKYSDGTIGELFFNNFFTFMVANGSLRLFNEDLFSLMYSKLPPDHKQQIDYARSGQCE
jgi:hypothetical protein